MREATTTKPVEVRMRGAAWRAILLICFLPEARREERERETGVGEVRLPSVVCCHFHWRRIELCNRQSFVPLITAPFYFLHLCVCVRVGGRPVPVKS